MKENSVAKVEQEMAVLFFRRENDFLKVLPSSLEEHEDDKVNEERASSSPQRLVREL